MKELKTILATPHPKMKNACDGAIEVYPKDKADKVIAELKEGAKSLILDNYLKDKEIHRHKHKRCLAMARWCRIHDEFTLLESERLGLPQRAIFMEHRRKAMWWNKWRKRWLELAEKFKEVK